jgi:hypothetical protein
MSAFELAAWNWFCGNVSRFTIEAGLLPALIMDLKLKDRIRGMFIKALSMVNQTADRIAFERAHKEAEAANG